MNRHISTPYFTAVNGIKEYNARRTEQCGKQPTAFVLTLGCQQNEADSEKIMGMAISMGYALSDSPEGTDLIVVNTCAIREHAEQRALSLIGQYKHLKASNPDLIIAACGCMTSRPERADLLKNSYPYVDIVFGTASLERLPEFIYDRINGSKRIFVENEDYSVTEGLPIKRESSFKAWVSVMYGCNNFCSYCIVPYVRGRERSRDPEDIIAEVTAIVKEGYKDITLLGQNVNSYGSDTGGKFDFPGLLESLAKIEGEFTLRFMTSHPKDVSDRLISVMAENDRVAKHFHLPLQSGSDKVLHEMNRKYGAEKYLETVDKLRAAMPDIAITSDIIVGFPGESDEDFEKTLEIVKKAEFDMIYPFIYSPREGTPAARREDMIPDEIKSERFDRLILLQNELSKKKNETWVGRRERVLVDGMSKKGNDLYTGRTDGGKLVHINSEKVKIGEFTEIKITGADTYALYSDER
ncbi:MAG: tRNA (N6-isopentenyl adenosine(37)-C2)-methylthiotransferase MiaB [Clostridia bacterium]|nr:tRNA (N6-isopentenyl adenosine(37)-C2)-methylthiotransferase MiaB [Clostridia bacterium]